MTARVGGGGCADQMTLLLCCAFLLVAMPARAQRTVSESLWYDPVLLRVTRIALSTGQAGEGNAVDLPIAIAGFYLVGGGDMVTFEVPAAATPGDTVNAVFRMVTRAGPSRILATVRHSSAFVAGSPVPVAVPLFRRTPLRTWAGLGMSHSRLRRVLTSVSSPRPAPRGDCEWTYRRDRYWLRARLRDR